MADLTDYAVSGNSRSPSAEREDYKTNKRLGDNSKVPRDILLAQTFEESINPVGYYISEKLDGIRGFWSGT